MVVADAGARLTVNTNALAFIPQLTGWADGGGIVNLVEGLSLMPKSLRHRWLAIAVTLGLMTLN